MRIVLASQSPRRRELLHMIGLRYEAVVSPADEETEAGMPPADMVKTLALRKARAVRDAYPDACVIGADTIVYIGGEIIGKPKDGADACRILKTLRGRRHVVYTGVAVLTPGREDVRCEETRVTFMPMTDNEVDWYVKTGEPLDKAGAYGIQGPGGMFVEKVEGNYFNVIGMPLPLLYGMLTDAGVIDIRSGT